MGRRRTQRGLSTSVQAALILPAIFSLLLLGLQWALYSWASSTALGAAQEGARSAAAYQATIQDGLHTANAAINRQALLEAQVSGKRTGSTVTVVVTGRSLSVLPYLSAAITKSVQLPVERITR